MKIGLLTPEGLTEEWTVDQNSLTADCWSIQFWGINSCSTCEFQNTDECGGKKIIKKMLAGEYPKDWISKPT